MARQRSVLGARQLEAGLELDHRKPPVRLHPMRRVRMRNANPSPQVLPGQFYRFMTVRSLIAKLFQQEDLNFLLTNRIPRRLATRFMGWFSKIEQPLVRDLSITVWRLFSDLDLSEAKTDALQEHARLLHPGTEGRRAARRRRSRRPGEPVRCDRGRVRPGRGYRADPGQGLSLHPAGSALRSCTRAIPIATGATSPCA